MAEPSVFDLEQLRLLQEQMMQANQQTQDIMSQPAQSGLLNQGQTLGDLFSNPTGPQSQAMTQFGLSLLGSSDRDPLTKSFSDAASTGLNLLNTARGAAKTQKLQAALQHSQGLQQKFGNEMAMSELAAKMQPAPGERDRFQKIAVPIGEPDPVTGVQPTREILVNLDEHLRRDPNALTAQVDLKRPSQGQGEVDMEVDGAAPLAEPEAQVTKDKLAPDSLLMMPPPPPNPTRSATANQEMQEGAVQALVQLDSLLEDVYDPNFKEVVGLGSGGIIKGKVAQFLETPRMGALSAFVGKGMRDRAIPLAKQLGVNPTDFDFKQIIASAPTQTDGDEVWKTWIERTFIPFAVGKLEVQHGKEYADQVRATVDRKVKATSSAVGPQVKTVGNVQYTVEQL